MCEKLETSPRGRFRDSMPAALPIVFFPTSPSDKSSGLFETENHKIWCIKDCGWAANPWESKCQSQKGTRIFQCTSSTLDSCLDLLTRDKLSAAQGPHKTFVTFDTKELKTGFRKIDCQPTNDFLLLKGRHEETTGQSHDVARKE